MKKVFPPKLSQNWYHKTYADICNSIVQVAKNTMKNHFKNINVHFINLHSPQRPGKLFLFEVLTEEN